MRLELVCVILGAILLAQVNARPQQIDKNETTIPEVKKEIIKGVIDDANNEQVRSRIEQSKGELNHYQHIDQSLRTVATQLLNVSRTNSMVGIKEDQETEPNLVLLVQQQPEKKNSQSLEDVKNNQNDNNKINKNNNYNENNNDVNIVKKINPEVISVESIGSGNNRPVNSKYHYMHVSNPGQAMALTDEELEIELSATRSPSVFHKNPSPSITTTTTTTGGISTWVQVNPPKTTPKPFDKKQDKDDNNIPTNTNLNEELTTILPAKLITPPAKIDITLKTEIKPLTTIIPKVTIEKTTPKAVVKKITTTRTERTTTINTITTPRPESDSTQSALELSATLKTITTRTDENNLSTTTKKTVLSNKNSSKPRSTTPKSMTASKTTTMKIVKPTITSSSRLDRPSKPSIIRKSSNKNDVTKSPILPIYNATSKIEKVTYKPVSIITTPKSHIESAPNAVFIKKLQASFHTDSNIKTPSAINESQLIVNNKNNNLNSTITLSKVSKPNNMSKVQLKKPIDTPTTIEIEPIKVNAPVLHIEKIEEKNKILNLNSKDIVKDSGNNLNSDNSYVDVKLNNKPEATNIETSTILSTTLSSSTTTAATATTKKPKGHSKRKKNKTRRRKPSSSSSTTSTTSDESDLLGISSVTEILQEIADSVIASTATTPSENSLQESKVVPDQKITSNNKNKKKQVVKPIGTQLYNYLSREVMPSFGVMSLVGLGLGLASYFLYPFGGVIARRSDLNVQQNYKYNIDEYGGNYGQKEEEVISKVLQGMTQNDDKYNGIIKDYEKNNYRYQAYDGAYGEPYTTIKNDQKYQSSSVPNYRQDNTQSQYDLKYRNTEFKYPDLTTTPNYYEHNKKQNIDYNKNHRHDNYDIGNVDRQFVVGNIPKEYSNDDEDIKNKRIITTTPTELLHNDFGKQIAQSMKFLKNPLEQSTIDGQQPEAQPLRNDGFDDIEIAPAAVVVEHGPRSLKLDDLVDNNDNKEFKKRTKRDSVIQLIPTRSEIEKEEHHEELSNEIINVIDDYIPESDNDVLNKNLRDRFNDMHKKMLSNTDKPREELTTSTANIISKTKEIEVIENETTIPTTSKIDLSTEPVTLSTITTTIINLDSSNVTEKNLTNNKNTTFNTTQQTIPAGEVFNPFSVVKKIAEIKFRLGLTILKRASENFAKYLGQVQKRINGEE